ncbi:MAG: hypothetical protein GY765_28620 [bacterium]|nr:hypothetical protein [bacterium]
MKKKEKEHLKEDPFQLFIEHTIEFMGKFKKQIITGVLALVILVGAIIGYVLIQTGSISAENKLFSDAIEIQNSDKLSLDEKIEGITKLESKSGISASIRLTHAALLFEKGDLKKAKEVLDAAPNCKYDLVNNKKKLLAAEILAGEGKSKEAIDAMYALFSDSDCEIAKDFLLLRMARIQVKSDQKDTAKANLEKIMSDYPRSAYRQDAQVLLDTIKDK